MVIRHSKSLLEQLSEVEEKIKELERVMDEFGVEIDREKLIAAILAKRSTKPSGQ